jgi:hypothetical protein
MSELDKSKPTKTLREKGTKHQKVISYEELKLWNEKFKLSGKDVY